MINLKELHFALIQKNLKPINVKPIFNYPYLFFILNFVINHLFGICLFHFIEFKLFINFRSAIFKKDKLKSKNSTYSIQLCSGENAKKNHVSGCCNSSASALGLGPYSFSFSTSTSTTTYYYFHF